jgi:hypothetical protein
MKWQTQTEPGMLPCTTGTTGTRFLHVAMANNTEMRGFIRLASATRRRRDAAETASSPTRAVPRQPPKLGLANPSINNCHDIENEDECDIRSNNNAHE